MPPKDEHDHLANGQLHADHAFQLLLLDPRSREALKAYLEQARTLEKEAFPKLSEARRTMLLSTRQETPSEE